MSDAAAAAAVGVAAAEEGSGPPVGTEAIGAGRWCGEIVRVVGTCGSWASPRNPEGRKRRKKVYWGISGPHAPTAIGPPKVKYVFKIKWGVISLLNAGSLSARSLYSQRISGAS